MDSRGQRKKTQRCNIPMLVLDIGYRTRIEFDTVPINQTIIVFDTVSISEALKLSFSVTMKKHGGVRQEMEGKTVSSRARDFDARKISTGHPKTAVPATTLVPHG